MRVAQISPLFEAVPPKLYGGTERVVYALTEELVAMGHDVTLFASGDSITSATLAPMRNKALRLDPSVVDWIAIYMRMMELIRRRAHEFDVLHFHTDYFPLSLFSRQDTPFLTTLHGRLDIPEFKDIYETFPDAPFVSISDSQRRPIPRLNWARTVLHGMPADLLTPQPVKQEYAAFLGRISPEKGVDKAIRIAGKAGLKLKIAAKVDNADKKYWNEEIKPLVDASPWVEFIGEINDFTEARIPLRCARAAVPHRLAGAVRPGDDRGNGLRHAGDRIQPRLGARGDRQRRQRVHRAR